MLRALESCLFCFIYCVLVVFVDKVVVLCCIDFSLVYGWIVCCLVALMVICFSCGCGGLWCLCSGLCGFVVRGCGGCVYGVLLFIVAWLCYLL